MAEKDYPAAHSADTMWYCVDECGHVAACYSSESGAIPSDALTEGMDAHTVSLEERKDYDYSHKKAIDLIDPAHLDKLISVYGNVHITVVRERGTLGAFLILSHLPKTLRAQIEKAAEVQKEDGKKHTPKIRELPDGRAIVLICAGTQQGTAFGAVVKQAHEDGLCLGCSSYYSVDTVMVGKDEKSGHALFYYRHPGSNGAPFPYFLSFAPENAVLVDDLKIPKEVKEKLQVVRLPGCFKDHLFWQPTETHGCELYDGPRSQPVRPEGATFEAMLHSEWGYM